MAEVRVHNISDRPNTTGRPQAVPVGRRKLRPGKSVVVDESAINDKLWQLQGTQIWIGDLPPHLRRTSRAGLAAAAARDTSVRHSMTLREARTHMESLSDDEIRLLAVSMIPEVPIKDTSSRPAMIARVSRAAFHRERILDPERWSWLGRWNRDVNGNWYNVED